MHTSSITTPLLPPHTPPPPQKKSNLLERKCIFQCDIPNIPQSMNYFEKFILSFFEQ